MLRVFLFSLEQLANVTLLGSLDGGAIEEWTRPFSLPINPSISEYRKRKDSLQDQGQL